MKKKMVEVFESLGITVEKKQMNSPSDKDFCFMYEILMKQIMPDFKMNQAKKEDIILEHMEQFQYHHAILKSSLKMVGVPHVWPHVLAFMVYLSMLLGFGEHVGGDEGVPTTSRMLDDGDKLIEIENDYYMALYSHAVNSSDTGIDEEAVNKINEDFKKDLMNVYVQNMDQQQTGEEIEKLEKEIDKLKNRADSVKLLIKKKDEMTCDNKQCDEDLKAEEKNVVQLDNTCDMISKRIYGMNGDMVRIEEEKKRCLETIQSHGYSAQEVREMRADAENKKMALKNMTSKLESLEDDITNRERECQDLFGRIYKNEEAYSKLARGLGLIPPTASMAGGRDLSMDVAADRETLHKLKVELEKIVSEERAVCSTLKEKLRDYEIEMDEVKQKKSDECGRIRESGGKISNLKQYSEDEEEKYKAKLEDLGEQNDALNLALEMDMKFIGDVEYALEGMDALKERLKEEKREQEENITELEQTRNALSEKASTCRQHDERMVINFISRMEKKRKDRNERIQELRDGLPSLDDIHGTVMGCLDSRRQTSQEVLNAKEMYEKKYAEVSAYIKKLKEEI